MLPLVNTLKNQKDIDKKISEFAKNFNFIYKSSFITLIEEYSKKFNEQLAENIIKFQGGIDLYDYSKYEDFKFYKNELLYNDRKYMIEETNKYYSDRIYEKILPSEKLILTKIADNMGGELINISNYGRIVIYKINNYSKTYTIEETDFNFWIPNDYIELLIEPDINNFYRIDIYLIKNLLKKMKKNLHNRNFMSLYMENSIKVFEEKKKDFELLIEKYKDISKLQDKIKEIEEKELYINNEIKKIKKNSKKKKIKITKQKKCYHRHTKKHSG